MDSRAQVLFWLSLAFNTIHPHILIRKLLEQFNPNKNILLESWGILFVCLAGLKESR